MVIMQEHFDYFLPANYPLDPGVQLGYNRYATIFMYLSDVEEGKKLARFSSAADLNVCLWRQVARRCSRDMATDICTILVRPTKDFASNRRRVEPPSSSAPFLTETCLFPRLVRLNLVLMWPRSDFNSLHGSCPVKKGVKWGANM
jgi:hypothetical protein